MNKAEFVNLVAEKNGYSKAEGEKAVNAVFGGVEEVLSDGDSVTLVGFGTFQVKERAPRTGRNPQTGATLQIPGATVPSFKAGKGLKDAVNKAKRKK